MVAVHWAGYLKIDVRRRQVHAVAIDEKEVYGGKRENGREKRA